MRYTACWLLNEKLVYQFSSKYSSDLYLTQLQALIDHGDVVDVRGRKTKEFLNVITEIIEPWHHCILLPSRRWNPWLALSEALWILAGRDDIAALAPYNSHIGDYSDDGVTLYGAYGARLYGQIDSLVERLRKDPSDRRAVLGIWNYHGSADYFPSDLQAVTKDPPCNNLIYFKLRHNKLHMTVICRSNDIHWGLYAVNLPTFGILQSYIAARLGVDMGTQTHLSNSLHVYTDDKRAVDITERMLYKEPEDRLVYPQGRLAFTSDDLENIQKHEQFARMCSYILDGKAYQSGEYPPFLNFANEFLWQYHNKRWRPDLLYQDYPDWVLAGQLFIDKVWKQPVAS